MDQEKETIPVMPIIAAIFLGAGILVAVYIAAVRELDATASLLLGISISSASILVSWLITHVYSQLNLKRTIAQATEANKENIRNYAVKAAEKVLNLSSQLDRLSDALSMATEDSENCDDDKETVMLLRERISAAIHNIETLRSINDTFLSDWRGVIGEEIQRQHLLESRIADLALELEQQKNERDLLEAQLVSPEDLAFIEERIGETEKRISQSLNDLPFRLMDRRAKPRKKDLSFPCPSCLVDIETSFRIRKGGKKLVQCGQCDQYVVIVGVDDDSVEWGLVATLDYEGQCPVCSSPVSAELADYAGAMKTTLCSSCDMPLLISRTQDDFNVRPKKPGKRDMTAKIVESIKSRLPEERPWPPHIHKQIAQELGYSNSLVTKVISQLISEGQYPLPQPAASNDEGGEANRD